MFGHIVITGGLDMKYGICIIDWNQKIIHKLFKDIIPKGPKYGWYFHAMVKREESQENRKACRKAKESRKESRQANDQAPTTCSQSL